MDEKQFLDSLSIVMDEMRAVMRRTVFCAAVILGVNLATLLCQLVLLIAKLTH